MRFSPSPLTPRRVHCPAHAQMSPSPRLHHPSAAGTAPGASGVPRAGSVCPHLVQHSGFISIVPVLPQQCLHCAAAHSQLSHDTGSSAHLVPAQETPRSQPARGWVAVGTLPADALEGATATPALSRAVLPPPQCGSSPLSPSTALRGCHPPLSPSPAAFPGSCPGLKVCRCSLSAGRGHNGVRAAPPTRLRVCLSTGDAPQVDEG